MHGKKIKIYHKGIKKLCLNCYEAGHFKKDCKEERKDWLDYVDAFMLAEKLTDDYYGNWAKLVAGWREKNPAKHDLNKKKQREEDERQERTRNE